MKFIWSDEYSVGVKLIDSQHKRFFEIANNIIDLAEKTPQREKLMNLVNDLGDYAFYHLNTEEEYFDEFNYKEAGAHVLAHSDFREKVQHYFNLTRDEKTDIEKLAPKVAEYTIDWLKNHIIAMDKKYSKCFKEHGLL